eukprot:jgi/Botrbrau1/17291/Bobra.0015s0048.1
MRTVEGLKRKRGAVGGGGQPGAAPGPGRPGPGGLREGLRVHQDLDAPNAERPTPFTSLMLLWRSWWATWPTPPASGSGSSLRLASAIAKWSPSISSWTICTTRCAQRALSSRTTPPLLAICGAVKDPFTGGPLSDSRLKAEFAIIFLAGIDTTGHTIGFALFRMATEERARAQVEQELDQLGLLVTPERPNPRPLEFADLANLHYLTCFMKESQRLIPVAGQGIRRTVKQDTTLGGYQIPQGTILWAAFRPLFRSPDLWDKPEEFIPERWMDPAAEYVQSKTGVNAQPSNSVDKIGTAKRYMPFGDGLRQCIGMSLAKMDYLTALAVLTSHFTMKLADEMGGPEGVYSKEVSRMTVAVRGGLNIHFYPRLPST